MKNLTLNKFSCTYLNSLILMFWFLGGKAQIVYTDIEPDFKSQNVGDFYNLDLNNDDITDFTLRSFDFTYEGQIGYLFIVEQNYNLINAIVSFSGFELTHPVPMTIGGIISSNLESNYIFVTNGNWFGPAYIYMDLCIYSSSYCSYGWGGKTDVYLGLRFLINGQEHYGWARLDVTSETNWVIKDYAYQATPSTGILAGQTSTLGLNDLSGQKNIKIATSNKTISVFNLPNGTTKYNLYAINGQIIFKGELEQANNNIGVQNLKAGLYIIELVVNNSFPSFTRKIVIR